MPVHPSQGLAAGAGLAGGFMQGFNAARQRSIEEAYLKIQMQREQMMQQREEREFALDPFKKMLNAETAPAILPAYSEALRYSKNPESYSYQPPAYEGPHPEGQEGPGLPITPPALSGAEGYAAMLSKAGVDARDLTIEAEARKQARQIELLRNQMQAVYGKSYERTRGGIDARADSADAVATGAEAQALGAGRGAARTAGARAAATAIGAGKMRPRGGSVALPGQDPIPVTDRVPSPQEIKDMSDVDTAISFVDGLAKSAREGGPGTGTGTPQAWWTRHAGKWTSVPVIGDAIRAVDPNIANRAAFHEALGQNLLTVLRTTFKGRISNFDIIFGQEVIPSALDGEDVVKAKLNELSVRLHAARAVLTEHQRLGGVAASEPVEVQIPAGAFTGQIGPAAPRPSGRIQLPGGPPITGPEIIAPEPNTPFKTFRSR